LSPPACTRRAARPRQGGTRP